LTRAKGHRRSGGDGNGLQKKERKKRKFVKATSMEGIKKKKKEF